MIDWLQREWRLLTAANWDDGRFVGPPDPLPCTSSHPACARLIERQEAIYRSMRRVKSHVLDKPAGYFTPAAGTDIRHTITRAMALKPHAIQRRKSA